MKKINTEENEKEEVLHEESVAINYMGVSGSKEKLFGSISRYSREDAGHASVDNGLYVKGYINGKPVNLLLDSGSTATLISKHTFDRLGIESLSVRNKNICVKGADGSRIKIYGREQFQIKLGEEEINHPVIVCDITTDGIVGQDFILKHAKRLDFDALQLVLRSGECVQCYPKHEAHRVCRVTVSELIEIPPQSYAYVNVTIPESKQLPATAFIENLKPEYSKVQIIEGLIDPHSSNIGVGVINKSEESFLLRPGENFGLCKSSYEKQETNVMQCTHISETIEADQDDIRVPEHLENTFEKSSVYLNYDEKRRFADLLKKYQNIFVTSSDQLGCTDKVKHKINTGDAQPIKQAPRRQPLGKRENERVEVERMLQKDIIEPSDSEWSSPVVLITKKDGSTRFCVDYRKLNSVTKVDAYPIPRVDDCLEALAGNKWFSSMDLCSGFWQVKMDEKDMHKTAFSTSCNGLYHFKVMPFGLVNSPATFQRLMENVLRGIQWIQSLLYMDDIITPGRTVDESLARLEKVFERLQLYNLKLKASKCIFFQKSITFLGHVVSEDGIHTDESKVSAIKDWPVPHTQKQVRSFLGLTGYYRKFIKGYADIARPLHKLCEKRTRFSWTESCTNAFNKLKESLITAPILAYPQPDCEFILDTDSSDQATGAVLSQIIGGKEHVIAYMSKTMNRHERQYCITRKELLAVIKALKHFHHYLYGRKFLLRTDNSAVSWMRNLKAPTGQTARWLQELSTYSMTVIHRPGRSHGNADALSRKPCNSCLRQQDLNKDSEYTGTESLSENAVLKTPKSSNNILNGEDVCLDQDDKTRGNKMENDNIVVTRATTRADHAKSQNSDLTQNQILLDGWTSLDIQTAQLGDPNISTIFAAKLDNLDRPQWSGVSAGKAELKTLWRQWDRLYVKGGMLYRKFDTDRHSHIWQLVVPESKRSVVLRAYHNAPSAGHLGFNKTIDKIRQIFYWPGMTDHIKDYCNKCDLCTARNLSKSQNKAPLGKYAVGEPMERVMMDILGPMPTTNTGNKYVLVITDWFTKWTEAIPLQNQEAKTVANAFIDTFVSRFGVPLQLYTDQGSNFESKLFGEICELLSIEKTHATSMRAQANGVVERFNRTLVSMISKYCQETQKEWDKLIPLLMLAYRSSIHSSTKVSPNKMVYGRNVILPLAAVIGRPISNNNDIETVEDYVRELRKNLEFTHDFARLNIGKSTEYQKRHYDCNAKLQKYSAGQCVWLHDPTRHKGVCSKLLNKWKGPYLVTKVLDDIVCLVKRSKSMKPKAYHIDRLWPYSGVNIPNWISREKARI